MADFWAYPLEWGDTLSNHDWMPFYINRFLSSEFIAHACAANRRDAIGTAIVLWAESFKQDPAGTLPDDDVALAQAARFGADVEGWKAVRDLALWGWQPAHINGDVFRPRPRLGHPVVARIAADMFRRKEGRDASREAGRAANQRHKVRARIRRLGYPKAHAESDQVVQAVADWLDLRNLYVTDENVRLAMDEAAGIPRVVARVGPGQAGARQV